MKIFLFILVGLLIVVNSSAMECSLNVIENEETIEVKGTVFNNGKAYFLDKTILPKVNGAVLIYTPSRFIFTPAGKTVEMPGVEKGDSGVILWIEKNKVNWVDNAKCMPVVNNVNP